MNASVFHAFRCPMTRMKEAAQIIPDGLESGTAIEVLMPALEPVALWKGAGRHEAFGDLRKFKSSVPT